MGPEPPLPTGLEILDGLEALKGAFHELAMEMRAPPIVALEQFRALEAVVESVGQGRPARPVVCPEEYLKHWKDLLAGRRQDLEPRAIRYLCWEPDVATDSRFLDYLERSGATISARALQGLVRGCHACWNKELFKRSGPASRLQRRLRAYDGPNRIVQRWRTAETMILGQRGADEFGRAMLLARHSVKEHCARWAIDEQSQYVLGSVETAMAGWAKLSSPSSSLNEYALKEFVFWAGWPRSGFKEAVATAIVKASDELRQLLKPLILKEARLGDPRLPLNAPNWRGVRNEARDRFISWLSADDIQFFFEHVLPHGHDPHGRKPFWLRYVNQVRMSRALLGWEDRQRLRGMTRKEEAGNFGLIEADTSAFLLDFGKVLVVEFSKRGNACYIYDRSAAREIVPDFWSTEPFSAGGGWRPGLKQQDKVGARIAHYGGWQWQMEQVLAQCGIRAGSGERE